MLRYIVSPNRTLLTPFSVSLELTRPSEVVSLLIFLMQIECSGQCYARCGGNIKGSNQETRGEPKMKTSSYKIFIPALAVAVTLIALSLVASSRVIAQG